MKVPVNICNVMDTLKQVPFRRFWIAEFCLAESLRSSPPIPLEAICALAGRLTDNHIFLGEGSPPSDTHGSPSVIRLVRLVKFDRFGTPVLYCREAQTDAKPVFHVRMFRAPSSIQGIVLVNGLARNASRDVISFFRTCICQAKHPDIWRTYDALRGEGKVQRKNIEPTCPIHGDAEFLIPELCLGITDDTEEASGQTIWSWIKENAATQKEPNAGCRSAYAPLDVGEIRLLRFFPVRLGRKGHVDVPMATIKHKLDETPKFVALSYCWGSSTRDCLLPMLTRETLEITQHLGQIIRDLVTSGITDVWIDQICIDQDNLEEKAIQVAQMLQIYKAADEVLIHLGPLSVSDKVVRFVKDIAPRCLRDGLSTAKFPTGLSQEDVKCWLAFRAARSTPWFSRVWIVQEMSVNPRTSLLLGNERVPWDDFLAADKLTNDQFFTSSVPLDIIGIYSMPLFARIRRQQQHKGGYDAVELFEILNSARFLKSSEPKDKVYAFLGVFDQTSVGKWLPFPDYRRDVADVYTSFAASYTLNGYALGLLQLAGTSQTSPDHQSSMPSWVPDWTFGNVMLRSLRLNRAFEHGEDGFSAGTRFEGSAGPGTISLGENLSKRIGEDNIDQGSGLPNRSIDLGDFFDRHRPRDPGLRRNDSILLPLISHIKAGSDDSHTSINVKTALFDEVNELTKLRLFEASLRRQFPDQELQKLEDALFELNGEAQELVSAHIDDDVSERTYRLARTLIADSWKEKNSSDLAHVHDHWLQALRNAKEGVPSGETDSDPLMPRYAGRVRQTLQNRMFGVTKGRRMGIFPSTTQLGDRVGIVAGLDLPCVFSERTEGFAFVGEAYVEGVMYGEFEETEEATFRELKIV
jgi:hypothetical protein